MPRNAPKRPSKNSAPTFPSAHNAKGQVVDPSEWVMDVARFVKARKDAKAAA